MTNAINPVNKKSMNEAINLFQIKDLFSHDSKLIVTLLVVALLVVGGPETGTPTMDKVGQAYTVLVAVLFFSDKYRYASERINLDRYVFFSSPDKWFGENQLISTQFLDVHLNIE